MQNPKDDPHCSQLRGKAVRILCVDDDEYIAQMVVAVLERAGYKVEWAADGQAALERIVADADFFGLVITDHRMPRLDGLELVRKLRESGFPGRIVVHTSHLSDAEVACYRGLAVDRILAKPAQVPDLLAAVPEARMIVP
jgi:CheY-like chemotaxis protein